MPIVHVSDPVAEFEHTAIVGDYDDGPIALDRDVAEQLHD
jgi:hypothetical protein